MNFIKQKFSPTFTWAKNKIHKNERFITFSALFGGLTVDMLTLTRIDQFYDNMVLVTYIGIAFVAIFLINAATQGQYKTKIYRTLLPYTTYLIQFAFGGLLSAFVIFYTRSASIYAAWPFLVLLYFLFLANDHFRDYYKKLEFQIAMLFGGIFGIFIFLVPTLNGIVDHRMFLLSGVLSLLVITTFLVGLYGLIPKISQITRQYVMYIIAGIYLSFHLLYFTHAIPPIPLSVKHGEIYYSVAKTSPGNYNVSYEKHPWYRIDHHLWKNEFYKTSQNNKVYAMISVFGPRNLKAELRHEWDWFNAYTGKWENASRSEYKIEGGRGGGFRWYSYITNPATGKWRIRVMTKHNREVGRMYVDVYEDHKEVELSYKDI